MTKVTTKTKKADLINEAIERNLFSNSKEASVHTKKELYDIIISADKLRDERIASEQNQFQQVVVNETNAKPKKRTLPKENDNNLIEKGIVEKEVINGNNNEVTSSIELQRQVENTDEFVDTETVDSIVATIEALKKDNVIKAKTLEQMQAKLNESHTTNNKLEEQLRILRKEINNFKLKYKQMYTEIISISNLMATTTSNEMLTFWDSLNTWLDNFIPEDGDLSVRFDMRKLIDNANNTKSLNENDYIGEHISFSNGEAIMPDGVSKRMFKKYKIWYDDVNEWVSYVVDELSRLKKMKNQKIQKKTRISLLNDLKSWYAEWAENCDDNIVDMVEETMMDLLNGKIDKIKTLSYFVAIIDELEFV